MLLPRGVTGFARAADLTLPRTDFRAFQAACYSAARRLGGTVHHVTSCEGRVTPNFHRAAVALQGETVEVICNASIPFVATIRPLVDGDIELSFVDVRGLAEEIRAEGPFQVLLAAELKAPLSKEVLSDLAWAEQQQVKYWKPRTVGEVIFHFWD